MSDGADTDALSERVADLEERVDELEATIEKEKELTERVVDVLEDRLDGEQLAYDLPEDDLRGFR